MAVRLGAGVDDEPERTRARQANRHRHSVVRFIAEADVFRLTGLVDGLNRPRLRGGLLLSHYGRTHRNRRRNEQVTSKHAHLRQRDYARPGRRAIASKMVRLEPTGNRLTIIGPSWGGPASVGADKLVFCFYRSELPCWTTNSQLKLRSIR